MELADVEKIAFPVNQQHFTILLSVTSLHAGASEIKHYMAVKRQILKSKCEKLFFGIRSIAHWTYTISINEQKS
jgi:hypothetical protein